MLNKPNNQNFEQGIISIMVVLGVGLFALSLALTATTGVLAEFAKNQNTTSGDQTFYTAESAVREGAWRFIDDQTFTGAAGELINQSSSSNITVTDLGWPLLEVTSQAENPRTNRSVTNLVTVFPEGLGFSYSIFATDSLSIEGSAQVTGDVFSNTDISFSGNKAEIDGDAFAVGDFIKNGGGDPADNITGRIVPADKEIPLPNIEDGPYRTLAMTDTPPTYFDQENTAENYLKNKNRSGVIFVENTSTGIDLSIEGNSTHLTGTLAVIGDLTLKAGTFDYATETQPAIYVDGDLTLNGNVDIQGLIYVTGVTTIGNGNYSIDGSLISKGGISISGNTSISFNPDVFDWPEIEGLDTTSSEPPRIIQGSWEEQ